MAPRPCNHCGNNFMIDCNDPSCPTLCNSCILQDKNRSKNKANNMENDTIGILIQCPRATQIEIEEICINIGVDFSKYLLDLHRNSLLIKILGEPVEALIEKGNSDEKTNKTKRK